MLVSVIRDVHRGQRGRSIGVSRAIGENWDFDMTLPARAGALPNSRSPMVANWRGGDGSNVPQCASCLLVNIAHSPKFHTFRNCENDTVALEKARVLAIGVSLDKPAVDPKRRISVLDADRHEISTVPVYSNPAWFGACDFIGSGRLRVPAPRYLPVRRVWHGLAAYVTNPALCLVGGSRSPGRWPFICCAP